MRSIEKQAEPACLADLRREAKRVERDTGKQPQGSDWAPRDCGDPMREALYREQQGLCAYCMRRIEPTGQGMKIEHFVVRSSKPRQMYDWDNLIGVCMGILHGHQGEVRICDTARGDEKLHIHPASKSPPRPEDVYVIKWTGRIEPRGDLAEVDCQTLNLNCDLLIESRRAVIKGLRNELERDDSVAAINRMLRRFRTPTNRGVPPYARVAIEYLERKLRSKGGPT